MVKFALGTSPLLTEEKAKNMNYTYWAFFSNADNPLNGLKVD